MNNGPETYENHRCPHGKLGDDFCPECDSLHPRTDAVAQRCASLPPVECLAEMDTHARQLEEELGVTKAKYDLLGRRHGERLLELGEVRRMYEEMLDMKNRARERAETAERELDTRAAEYLEKMRQMQDQRDHWQTRYALAETTLRTMIGDERFERLQAVAERGEDRHG